MRPSTRLLVLIILIAFGQLAMYRMHYLEYSDRQEAGRQMKQIVGRFGLTDLCLATDARYIRHLSVSDPVAPVMDHPGAIEHFPSSSFIAPVR